MSYIAQHAAPRDTQASPDPYGRIPPTAKPGRPWRRWVLWLVPVAVVAAIVAGVLLVTQGGSAVSLAAGAVSCPYRLGSPWVTKNPCTIEDKSRILRQIFQGSQQITD
jgi:hypothetical protein